MNQIMEDPTHQPREWGSDPLGQAALSGHWRPLRPHPGAVTDGVSRETVWGSGSPVCTQPAWGDR